MADQLTTDSAANDFGLPTSTGWEARRGLLVVREPRQQTELLLYQTTEQLVLFAADRVQIGEGVALISVGGSPRNQCRRVGGGRERCTGLSTGQPVTVSGIALHRRPRRRIHRIGHSPERRTTSS